MFDGILFILADNDDLHMSLDESWLFLLGSFSSLQVTMSYIRAWMSLKFAQICPRITELAALERLKISMSPLYLGQIHFKFVDKENMHNI